MMRLVVAILAFIQINSITHATDKTVYGSDDRLDYNEVKDQAKTDLIDATAAMIPSSLITEMDNITSRIKGKTLQQYGICEYEKFYNQVAAADCSGFLIAPDIIVTAGHCIRNNADCSYWRWVFDYRVSTSYRNGRKFRLPTKKIYNCKEVIASEYSEREGVDYAVIRLNRPVLDREPLKIRKIGSVTKEDKLVVIGYPSGLPVKYAGGAKVLSNDHSKYFLTDLDTFNGNSGSAVLNEETGIVEGILVRGNEDYEYVRRKGKRCLIPKVCTSKDDCEGEGESVTRISEIHSILKKNKILKE
jgi:V8-like Glu-specific endopeptidase